MNHGVRGVVALGVLLMGVSTAQARPRIHVPPFTVARGGEAVAYFGPEVARAVAARLEAASIEVGAGAETSVQGRIEELDGERVRLTATVRGHSASVEGPLESIDQIAVELARRLIPILEPQQLTGGVTKPGVPRSLAGPVPRVAPVALAAREPPKEPAKETSPAPAPVAAPAGATPPAAAPAASTATPTTPAAPTAPRPTPAVRTSGEDDEESAPARVAVTSPPSPPRVARRADPYEILQPSTQSQPPTSYPPAAYGFVRGRVVAHAIADAPNAFAGTGSSAPQAFYYFLRRRLSLQVIPTGFGMQSPQVAADEGWRSGARAVMMARLVSIEYRPSQLGQSVSCRVEVVVVRDGHTVLRRLVESGPTDPALAAQRRTRYSIEDPIGQAVSAALETILPDLSSALTEIR